MTRYRAPPITRDLFKIETVTVLPVYSDTRSVTRVINEMGLIPVTQSKLLKIVTSKQARFYRGACGGIAPPVVFFAPSLNLLSGRGQYRHVWACFFRLFSSYKMRPGLLVQVKLN